MKTRKYIPSFLTTIYHFSLSFLGAFFYGFPSRKIKVIGVTGTSGKSTTVELIGQILEKSGKKIALLSSIHFKIGKREWVNKLKMTMPGRLRIQKFLRKAQKEGCEIAILEVTSEGIAQFRHKFIDFDIACFLNLKPEHIESHGSFRKYKETKRKLFLSLEKSKKKNRVAIFNLDDPEVEDFLKIKKVRKIGFTLSSHNKRERFVDDVLRAEKIRLGKEFSEFEIRGKSFHLPLPGLFNVQNALCAVAVGLSQNISLEKISSILREVKKVEGRMEEVVSSPFKVFVDYAHTPHSLRTVYNFLRKEYPDSSLICVLGSAGGGRDKWKREVLGEIAFNCCQEIIVTNEDPYDEDPKEIIRDVLSGTKGKGRGILDRREAIRKALSLAKKGDIVIITGKGSEPWMCLEKGKKIPWSDKKIVLEEFEKLYGKIQNPRA